MRTEDSLRVWACVYRLTHLGEGCTLEINCQASGFRCVWNALKNIKCPLGRLPVSWCIISHTRSLPLPRRCHGPFISTSLLLSDPCGPCSRLSAKIIFLCANYCLGIITGQVLFKIHNNMCLLPVNEPPRNGKSPSFRLVTVPPAGCSAPCACHVAVLVLFPCKLVEGTKKHQFSKAKTEWF